MCKARLSTIWLLALASAVLLSLPWMVPGTGALALVGFVPLLLADSLADEMKLRRFRYVHYSCFVVWNAITTVWVWNATPGGAVFAILANALQMSLVFGLFRLGKRHLNGILPYLLLAAAWIAWERWYLTGSQISWPWLVLGNAFARTTKLAQWYEYTGTLGGSAWVWACNLGIFSLIEALRKGRFAETSRKIRIAALSALGLAVFLPVAASLHLYYHYEEPEESIDALVLQPNFDPYHKFQALSQKRQNAILLELADSALAGNTAWKGLLIAPETFTNDVILPDVTDGNTFRTFKSFLQSYPSAGLLFGAGTYEYFDEDPHNPLSRQLDEWFWRIGHNSAVCMAPDGRYSLCHKGKLVVGVEATPYPKLFVPLDNMLGNVMGRLVGPRKPDVLEYYAADSTVVPFGCAICYESVYGEYCAEYVRKGARFMTVITNDAWWGDTPGYRQHLSFAALRAIELRRDLARCGNTGISAFINGRGDIVSSGDWWTRETLAGTVHLSDRLTLFARLGDVPGRICVLAFLLLLFLLLRKVLLSL